jgi:uncharacterized protein YjdB
VKSLKRTIALLLVNVMLLTMLPLNTLAQESTAQNPGEQSAATSLLELDNSQAQLQSPAGLSAAGGLANAENPKAAANRHPNAKAQLLAALAEQYGPETASAMIESMISMGIIDENGNRLTYRIEMDGEFYTLEQMRSIVTAPDADLSKEVKVDDQTVTLDFIARLIDFEDYMQFVEDNFIKSQVNVTGEHLEMLADLEQQLNSEGINLVVDPDDSIVDEVYGSNPLEKVPEEMRFQRMASVPAPAPVPVVECTVGAIAGNTVDVTYTMTEGGDDSVVTFTQECLGGVLGNINPSPQTITLTAGNPTETATINLPDTAGVIWNGSAPITYLHLNNLNGGKFANGKSNRLVPIIKTGNFGFTAYKGQNLLVNPQPDKNLNGWTVTKGYWNNGDYGGEIKGNVSSKVTAYQDVQLNADAINLAANGELQVAASGKFWGQPSSTMTANLYVKFYDKDGNQLDAKQVNYKKYKVTRHNETLSFSGYTVPAGTTRLRLEADNDNSLTAGPSMRQFSLTLTDVKAPVVTGISAPSGTFKAGEQVPIVVNFSEPIVQGAAGLTLIMKDGMNKTYHAYSTNLGLKHSQVVFLFDIPPATPVTLSTISVTGAATDVYGRSFTEYYNYANPEPLPTAFQYNELDSLRGITLQHADGSPLEVAYQPNETRGRLEIPLFQSNDPTVDGATIGQKQNEWLISHTTPDSEGRFTVDRLYASYDNGATRIPLYITDAVDKLTGEFDLPEGSTCKIVLYLATDAAATQFRPILEDGYSAGFTTGTLYLVEARDLTINYPESYPSGIDKVLNIGDEEMIRLSYTYSGNATFQNPEDFKWVSTNERVASISATGEITPMSVGTVTFKLIAMNGRADGSRDVAVESEEFKVQVSLDKPALAVSKYITTKQGVAAEVMWSTNIISINQQADPKVDTVFTVELFEGNYATVDDLGEAEPIYTGSSGIDASSFTIPGEHFTRVSMGMDPAYTVKISTDNPKEPGSKVEALGHIIVTSSPAYVKITRPENYYVLDTAAPLTVSWESFNVNDNPGACDFEFEVTKNQDSIYTSQDTQGSYTINFGNVTGKLKDVYTVTAKIKNTGDEAYSYDSFVLHVYDAEAMKIWVDKQDTSTLVMDNSGYISGLSSAEIVALERNISLTNQLSINYGDYPYGLVTDQIEWKSSNSRTASINYSQGGAYKNIEDYDLSSYMPNTNFILAGLKNGTATINATHKLSRMTDTLGVEVKTLKDKLYLFQVMPMVRTEFNYINGDGQAKTVASDDKGAVAIYEEKGIKSDVKLKSTIGDSTYLGTIYNANLLSGENDGSKGQLYPINNFVLREAAQVELNFKKPDGTPYTGTVTIRGGVYKNGNYCETTEISDNLSNTLSITPDNGFHRQIFDITRFWSEAGGETSATEVTAADKIDYVFEFHFGSDDYLPQLVKFSGNLSGADVVRFGESVVNLVPVAPADKDKPFFAAQYLDRYKKSGRLDNIKNNTGNIGLNAQTPKIRIDTQALWWGRPVTETNAAVTLINENGTAVPGQNYKTFKYPFGTMLVTEHQLVIDQNNIWMDQTGRGKLTVKLINDDGTLYNATLAPYSIRNMLGVENVAESDDVNANFEAEMKKSIIAGASFDAKDKFAQRALDFISGIQFGNDNFSLILAPTSDPTVFNGLLQLNAGDDVMDMGPDEDGFSLMLDDDEVESIGTEKSAFAKSRELASGLEDDIKSIIEDSDDNFSYQVGGYFNCRIVYNFDKARWEVRPIGGGIRAGISYQNSVTGNSLVGPVPVTYEVALGVAVRLEFDAHMLYEPVTVGGIEYRWQADKEMVTDYLTNLRLKAFIYAFGGLGFDATIVALKIGVFGQLDLENQNKFLNRNYLDPAVANQPAGYNQTEKALSGSWLSLQGQVGIKFVAKLLFISYQKTFASAKFGKEWTYRNWDKIENYWRETTGDMLTPENMVMATRLYAAATGQDVVVISQEPQLESRDYLHEYARVWGKSGARMRMGILSLDPVNLAPDVLQSNAYPYADPLIADDGSMFVYLSDNNSPDVWDTTANYAIMSGDSYSDRGTINNDPQSFGDSQLSFDSANGSAIAAWVRLIDKIEKNAGDQLTNAEMSMMINNTEVYVSTWRGGSWTTERLTDNNTPDMAPVVATNGNRAIAAWRSVYAGDPENPTDFSGRDAIVYRVYNGGNWSETRTLYNGVSGGVVGLAAAMTSDGTAAVSYIIDTGEEGDSQGYEIVYGVVDSGGDIVKNVRLTNDNTSDENPQLTVTRIDGDERFILGWFKVDGSKSDIRLATFGNDGSPKEDFIDSLYAVSSTSNISNNFKFVHTSPANSDFKNLSVLWVERDPATNSDDLKAIKFMRETVDETKLTFTSAAVEVAKMPDKTSIDNFDAYVSDPVRDEVKVIILGTESKDEFETVSDTDQDGNPVTIDVPKTESKMFTATESYKNKAAITAAEFNYTEILSGFMIPVSFTVQNQGKDLITAVTLEYGPEGSAPASKTFEDLKILPGTSTTLVVYNEVPESIVDVSYRGTAVFGETSVEMTGSGTLRFAVADVGISGIRIVKEQDGVRELTVTLYNSSDYKLSTSGRSVKLALYDNSVYTAGTEVVPIVTISDPDDLSLVDNGAYTANISFNLKQYLIGQGKDEIPANGVTLYAKVWVVNESGEELSEYVGENNFSTVLFENLVKRNLGNAIKVDVDQSNSATQTTAILTLQNLAMRPVTNGNVAVNLLDEGGNIIKTLYLSNTAAGLVNLGSEGVITKTFVFDTLGADVEAHYFTATADSMNADLQVLKASGIGVGFDKDTTTYAGLKASGLKTTNVTAISANPNARVLLKDAGDMVLSEQTGAITYTMPLAIGSNSFKVTVEPDGPGAQPKTYAVTVVNEAPASGSVTLSAAIPGTRGWWTEDSVPVTLTATGLTNFTPTKLQYKVGEGDWTTSNYSGSPAAVTTVTAEGNHVVSARLQDANGYNLTANSLTVKIDRTAPAFTANRTSATLTEGTLVVSTEVTDALSGIYSVVMTRGGETYPLLRQEATDTYSVSIPAGTVGPITITATDMAGNTAQTTTGNDDPIGTVPVTGITLDQATMNLTVGGATGTLTATVAPENATNTSVTWSSSNEAVASVVNGVVTPLTAGSTNITVTTVDGGKTATCVVTVTAGGGGGGGGGSSNDDPNKGSGANGGSIVVDGTTIANAVTRQYDARNNIESFTVTSNLSEALTKALASGRQTMEIAIAGEHAAAAKSITVPANVLNAAEGLNLQITTPLASIQLPAALVKALSQAGQELVMEVSSGTTADVSKKMDGVSEVDGALILGTPTQINTTLTGNTRVTIPLTGISIPSSAAERQAFLDSLGVFVVHNDGETQLITPTIVNDASGKPVAISFNVDKFSTFAIVKLAPSQPAGLTDITGHWAKDNIEALVEMGAITGYANGTFQPQKNITRAEFATILVKAYNLTAPSGKVFSDTWDHWAKSGIGIAYAHNIVSGHSDSEFRPDDNITREQMAVMIVQAEKATNREGALTFADVDRIAGWAKNAVLIANQTGIITGYPDNTFRPQGYATRAEAATVVLKAIR